jgi:acylphosphatase
MKAVALRIRGRVQGVYFRGSAQDEAERLGIVGYARNESDGSVAAFAQGEDAAVDQFVEWCRHGPPSARVSAVEVTESAPQNFRGFRTD